MSAAMMGNLRRRWGRAAGRAALLAVVVCAGNCAGSVRPGAAPTAMWVAVVGPAGGNGDKGATESPLRLCPLAGRVFACGHRHPVALDTRDADGRPLASVDIDAGPDLARGLPASDSEVVQMLGRWPASAWLVLQRDLDRPPVDRREVLFRWRGDRWHQVAELPPPSLGMQQRYAFWHDGILAIHEPVDDRGPGDAAGTPLPGYVLVHHGERQLSAVPQLTAAPRDPAADADSGAECRGTRVAPRWLGTNAAGEVVVRGVYCSDRGRPSDEMSLAEERWTPGRQRGLIRRHAVRVDAPPAATTGTGQPDRQGAVTLPRPPFLDDVSGLEAVQTLEHDGLRWVLARAWAPAGKRRADCHSCVNGVGAGDALLGGDPATQHCLPHGVILVSRPVRRPVHLQRRPD
jgi:hypothetical protein